MFTFPAIPIDANYPKSLVAFLRLELDPNWGLWALIRDSK